MSSHLLKDVPNDLIPSCLSTKILCAFLISPFSTMYSAHQILHLVIISASGEEYKLWHSILRSFQKPSDKIFPLDSMFSYFQCILHPLTQRFQLWGICTPRICVKTPKGYTKFVQTPLNVLTNVFYTTSFMTIIVFYHVIQRPLLESYQRFGVITYPISLPTKPPISEMFLCVE